MESSSSSSSSSSMPHTSPVSLVPVLVVTAIIVFGMIGLMVAAYGFPPSEPGSGGGGGGRGTTTSTSTDTVCVPQAACRPQAYSYYSSGQPFPAIGDPVTTKGPIEWDVPVGPGGYPREMFIESLLPQTNLTAESVRYEPGSWEFGVRNSAVGPRQEYALPVVPLTESLAVAAATARDAAGGLGDLLLARYDPGADVALLQRCAVGREGLPSVSGMAAAPLYTTAALGTVAAGLPSATPLPLAVAPGLAFVAGTTLRAWTQAAGEVAVEQGSITPDARFGLGAAVGVWAQTPGAALAVVDTAAATPAVRVALAQREDLLTWAEATPAPPTTVGTGGGAGGPVRLAPAGPEGGLLLALTDTGTGTQLAYTPGAVAGGATAWTAATLSAATGPFLLATTPAVVGSSTRPTTWGLEVAQFQWILHRLVFEDDFRGFTDPPFASLQTPTQAGRVLAVTPDASADRLWVTTHDGGRARLYRVDLNQPLGTAEVVFVGGARGAQTAAIGSSPAAAAPGFAGGAGCLLVCSGGAAYNLLARPTLQAVVADTVGASFICTAGYV